MLLITTFNKETAITKKLGELKVTTDRFYQEHATEYFERTISADLSGLYQQFLALIPKNGRILDVGCGSGRDLRVFSKFGFRPEGIDASQALVSMASRYSKMPCVVGRMEDISFNSQFDGIWASGSLLHLPKNMLVPVLRRLHKALVPGGIIFASAQEGEGEKVAADGRFFSYYNISQFEEAFKKSGFLINDTWRSNSVLPGCSLIPWINLLAKTDPNQNDL